MQNYLNQSFSRCCPFPHQLQCVKYSSAFEISVKPGSDGSGTRTNERGQGVEEGEEADTVSNESFAAAIRLLEKVGFFKRKMVVNQEERENIWFWLGEHDFLRDFF